MVFPLLNNKKLKVSKIEPTSIPAVSSIPQGTPEFKLVVVGDGGVGKT